MNQKPLTLLNTFPQIDDTAATAALQKEWDGFSPKIVVLDDDPTGIQTVHDVSVYTDWEKETLSSAFQDDSRMFFILTNSRSFSSEKTTQVHHEIAQTLSEIAKEQHQAFLLISRGDSTLRGHYPLETDVLKDTLETNSPYTFDGEILCPFFAEGGRYTVNNIHYVKEGDFLTPAGNTEFAKDKTFSYKASDLTQYIEEKSHGAYKAADCICISLEELRACSYDRITEKLMSANHYAKIVVNAICYTDLKIFAVAWVRAMKRGKHFLSRSAAALPKIIGNIPDKPLLTQKELNIRSSDKGGLIVIGSHVRKTTAQFFALKNSDLPLKFLEFHVNAYFEDGGLELESRERRLEAEKYMEQGNTVVIYTSRELLAPEGTTKEELLSLSVNISDALTSIVSNLTLQPKFIIAKGGITSSDVGTKGLRVKKARVMGQIQPGIPVWMTGEESKFPNTPYVIFPGNVGNETTLRDIAAELI